MQSNRKAKQDKDKKYYKEYYEINRNKIIESRKKYRENNPDKEMDRHKKWYETNRDKINEHQKKYREANRDRTLLGWLEQTFKNTPCMDCKNVFPFICMDFDHLPGETKSFKISNKNKLLSTPERLVEVNKEIEKCDFVCANCHRLRTKYRSITQC